MGTKRAKPQQPSRFEMLRQLQALGLVVRPDALAIKLVRLRQHLLINEPADDLTVLEDERHFARAHFENGARATAASARIAKSRIEKARIMYAKLADQRIKRHHLG